MKKIITAINNPKLHEELNKEKNFEIIGKDIQYKEAILEMLEQNNDTDLIIISEKISGKIKLEELIKNIKTINEKIKIIFILEKENKDIERILIRNNIIDIYDNNKINLKELINIINKKEINMEEEIIKLKKIIEEKNNLKNRQVRTNLLIVKYIEKLKKGIKKQIEKRRKKFIKKEKRKNMLTKIITFSGNYKSGKSSLALIISQYLAREYNKVLLIDGDMEKQDLNIILKKGKFKNQKNRKGKKQNNKVEQKNKNKNISSQKNNEKRTTSEEKINNNLYFMKRINNLIKKNSENFMMKNFLSLKQKYNFIIIDLAKNNDENINKEILKNSDINFLVIEPNILGIKEIERTIDRYINKWKIDKGSLHIIANKKKYDSMNKKIISKFFFNQYKIYEIKENKIFSIMINHSFKNKILLKNKKIISSIKKIVNKILYK